MSESSTRLDVVGDGASLEFVGEIDAHTAPQFSDALAALGDEAAVRVGLTEVGFMDSSGLRVLLETNSRLEAGGGSLTLVAPSRAIRRLIEISGLDEHLTVTD